MNQKTLSYLSLGTLESVYTELQALNKRGEYKSSDREDLRLLFIAVHGAILDNGGHTNVKGELCSVAPEGHLVPVNRASDYDTRIRAKAKELVEKYTQEDGKLCLLEPVKELRNYSGTISSDGRPMLLSDAVKQINSAR